MLKFYFIMMVLCLFVMMNTHHHFPSEERAEEETNSTNGSTISMSGQEEATSVLPEDSDGLSNRTAVVEMQQVEEEVPRACRGVDLLGTKTDASIPDTCLKALDNRYQDDEADL
ncbi:MAG: hypothetical protein OXG08_02565 [Gammaproteobacteria bacterium]|nr:hypothetical protein [Gammaproteobacteria bacterium]